MPLRKFQIQRLTNQLFVFGAYPSQTARVLKIADRESVNSPKDFVRALNDVHVTWTAYRLKYTFNLPALRDHASAVAAQNAWSAYYAAENSSVSRREKNRLLKKAYAAREAMFLFQRAFARAWIINKLALKPASTITVKGVSYAAA